MSNDESQKADQIAHRLYTKLILVVNHARATAEPSEDAKVDHWFNLDIPDPDIFRRHTRIYRSISTTHYVPVFQLQVLLCVPELTNNQVLAHLAPDSSRLRIEPTPKYILLETWDLVFTPAHTQQEVFAATMYKHSLTLFRSIFTMLRILPSWKLARRLRRRGAGGRGGNFSIELHVQGPEEGGETVEGILGFGMPPAPTAPAFSTDSHSFPKITHATGCFAFSATYLTSPNFQLESLESVLSSRFLSLDEGPDFTPTLVKNQQRDSISGSPGSLPVRTSLPRSPPRSIADRFVLPPAVHTRTTSLPGLGGSSPRGMQPVALPGARRPSNAGIGTAGSTSGMSDGSSSRQGAGSTSSRDDAVSTLAARLRRESMGAGRGYDGPSPGPVPIRQQALSTVNPFKSSTLSSGSPSLHSASHSLRQHSPLSSAGGPSLPARPAHTSPTSSRLPVPPSPIGIGSKMPSSPVTPLRPSPPFAPSSLGDRHSVASADGAIIGAMDGSPRMSGKRYSSSFGHRYAVTGGVGSEGSAGSGAKEGANTSFVSATADDDDISAFVQEIDSRKPLGAMRDQGAPVAGPSEDRDATVGRTASTASRARTLSMPQPMLTTESAVDERLREMNETFLASLQGLGSRRREQDDAARAARRSTSGSASGTRRLADPIAYVGSAARQEGVPLEGARVPSSGFTLPPAYVRPRFGSTGSARSAASIASEEVLGRMDPEIGDERRRSRGP